MSHFISHSSQLWQGGEWSLKVPKNATVNSVSKLRTFAPTTTFCFSSLSGKQSAQLNANHTIIIVVFAVVVIVVAVWVVVALVVVVAAVVVIAVVVFMLVVVVEVVVVVLLW